jgi:ADP-heptose:LPS heptosyltransferase
MPASAQHVLVVRLDSMGDVLVCGPAVRAIAAGARRVTMLAGPTGSAAARLLPGVNAVMEWDCPWIGADPRAVERTDVQQLLRAIAGARVDAAVVLTSFHQSSLPTALLLRIAGVPRITAVSDDYPGSLLDVRVPSPPEGPEPERMLAIARAAGFDLPAGDDGRLAVSVSTGRRPRWLPTRPFVVAHPGANAPARAYPPHLWRDAVAALAEAGWDVVVTGGQGEVALTALAAARPSGATAVDADPTVRRDQPGWAHVHDFGGRLELRDLVRAVRHADVIVAANTGPAHVAAAVGTPVVSLFAPVVPAVRWRPYGVPHVLLGDQDAACRDSRARRCPIEGHPCLSSVTAGDIVAAVAQLARHAPSTAVPAAVGAPAQTTRGDA